MPTVDHHHLIIYYVGHGGFIDQDEYFLALRNTREYYERTSSLVIKALADVVKLDFPKGNVYIVLDCCFAGAAVQSFQSGMLSRTLNDANKRIFPGIGTTILCASSRDRVALSQGSGNLTQFSECFTEVLEQGIQGAGPYLDLRLIYQAVRTRAEKFGYRRIDPDLHSPRQTGTDAAEHKFIPNAAYVSDEGYNALGLTPETPSQKKNSNGKLRISSFSTRVAVGIGIVLMASMVSLFVFLTECLI